MSAAAFVQSSNRILHEPHSQCLACLSAFTANLWLALEISATKISLYSSIVIRYKFIIKAVLNLHQWVYFIKLDK